LLLAVAILSLSAGCTLAAPQLRPAGHGYRIGYLTSSAPDSPASVEGFQQFRHRLQELGRVEGEHLTIEYRFPQGGGEEGFEDLAAELVRLRVDVIVVGDSRAIPVVKAATSTIPIVMTVSGDVVGQGLVESLARPGGNLTGLTNLSRPLDGKRLELLLEAVPGASRVAVLWNSAHPGVARDWQTVVEPAAPSLGVELVSLGVQRAEDLDGAFRTATERRADALYVMPDPLTNTNAQRIIELAARSRLPAIFGTRLFVDAGGLMYYGPSRAAMFRRAAEYVDKILTGSRPADLPIEQPTRFEFVIDLKAAETLGLSIPETVLLQATELRV
jgi:putative ABC transport system substrate-binding protein